jgi:hypothetical protein
VFDSDSKQTALPTSWFDARAGDGGQPVFQSFRKVQKALK